MIWSLIGCLAAFLTMFGFVPQVLKMMRTHSVKDVSILTFSQFAAGVFLWVLYGIHLGDPIIITANTVTLLSVLIGIFFYCKYKVNSNA